MADIRAQVNELADLQGRSAALIALAEQNAAGRANIAQKVTEIEEQISRVGDVMSAAKLVADRVEGANEKQTQHLEALEGALRKAPTAEELDDRLQNLKVLATSLNEQGPRGLNTVAPPSKLSAVTPPFVPSAPPAGGYRYSRRRKTPTRKRKTPSRRRRKHKTRRRR